MTIQELAKKQFPYLTLKPKWATECERIALVKGLEIASEYGNWLGGYAITKEEADKLLEQFLTEKYTP